MGEIKPIKLCGDEVVDLPWFEGLIGLHKIMYGIYQVCTKIVVEYDGEECTECPEFGEWFYDDYYTAIRKYDSILKSWKDRISEHKHGIYEKVNAWR